MFTFGNDEKKFKFTIIMAVYNSKRYLKESVESVINQDIDFKNNVQLILVDDGSLDDSREICLKYQEKCPENILVLSQEHAGIAAARNLGMQHAQGEYINFLDSDDYLSENALSEVYSFFESSRIDTDVVSIPITHFERETNDDELNGKFKNNRVIDLQSWPNTIQSSLSSCFIDADAITESFDCELVCSEDVLFLYKILLEKKTLGVLNTARYYYRKRISLDAVSDSVHFKKEFYTDRLNDFHLALINYCKSKENEVPPFVQHLLAYDLKGIIKQEDVFMCDEDSEAESLFESLRNVASEIDKDVILKNRYLDSNLRFFLYNLSTDGIHREFLNGNVLLKIENKTIDDLQSHKIWLTEVDLNNNSLKLSGFINSYFNNDNVSVEGIKVLKNGDEISLPASYIDKHDSINRTYLDRPILFRHFFTLNVPVDDSVCGIRLDVVYYNNADKSDCNGRNISRHNLKIDFSKRIKFSHSNNVLNDGNYELTFEDNLFKVKKFFKFAVVMAIYNTEEYLNEAIDSIINQTIGFKENVQLILVNDGSEDSSEDILLGYQRQYPENVIVITQENSGQASARNNGLNYVSAKFVNFLDSDDYLENNAFEVVYPFFEKHYDETNIVAIPITFFGKKESPHMLNDKFTGSKIINLDKDPNNPQLSASSAFFRSDVLKSFKFPTNVIFSEDAILINEILLEKKTLGIVDSTAYYYRKRFDESSTIDVVHNKKEFFTDKLKDYYMYLFDYAKHKQGGTPDFLQYTLAYDLQWVFHEDLSLLNKQEQKEFWYYLQKVVNHIGIDAIQNNKFIRNKFVKEFFLAMRKNGFQTEVQDNNVLIKIDNYVCDRFANHNLWLDIVDLRDGYLNISGFYNSLFDFDHISIEAIKEENGENTHYIGKYVKYTSREDLQFLSKTYQYKNNFDIHIPIKANETSHIKIRVNYHKDGNNQNFSDDNLISTFMGIQFAAHCKLSKLSNYKVNGSNLLFFRNNSFYLIPTSMQQIAKKEILDLRLINNELEKINDRDQLKSHRFVKRLRTIYLLTYPFFKLMNRNKKIFLFEDRIDVADDNSTHLFKYAVNVKDNVKKYFVLSKESPQYKSMSKFGKILNHGSFKHKLIMLHADKVITTHPYETVINPFWDYPLNQRHLVAGLLNYQIYFLQHGVTKDNISDWMSKYDKNLSLMLTVSDAESKSFLDEGYGYDESIIQNLGFPRFDNLEKNDNKQILIIPTWRKTIRGEKKLFINSDYFESLNSFLNNPELKDFIKKGYKVVFKPHPELVKNIGETEERYIDLFDIPDYIYVSKEESYQELLNNSSLMITDYSSVYFDFAYLKKPVIYYHPADDYHYEGSYFDYDTMGFGDVIASEDDLISKIGEYVENNCLMEDEYRKRVDDFFTYHDKNNCKRVYDWIKEN